MCKRIKRKEHARLVYATHLKRIMDHSLEGVEYKFNKEKDFGVVFSKSENGGINTDKIEVVKMLVNKSIRDDAYKAAFPVIKKQEGEKTLDEKKQQAHRWLVKFAKDNNMTVKAAKVLVSALED